MRVAMDNHKKKRKRRKQEGIGGNGAIFALCGALAGLLSMVKRIPLTNIIGDNGNAYFSMAFDTYTFFFLFCGYAAPAVAAKMTSARCVKGQFRNTRRVWNASIGLTLGSGLLCTLLMLFLSDFLAGSLYGEPLSAIAMKLLSVNLLLASVLGMYRGFFQGMGTMVPTSLSRFLEEVLCLAVMLLAAGSMGDYGGKVGALLQNSNYEQAFGAAGGILGLVAGSAVPLLFLLVVFAMFQSSFRKKERKDMGKGTESYRRIVRILMLSTLPVILIALVTQGSVIVDQIMFLKLSPSGRETIVQWGVYSGKYRILANMPAVVVTAVCASLVPAISVSNASMNIGRLKEKSQMLIRLSVLLALPAAVFFTVMADTLIPALFKVGEMDLAAKLLRIGSITIVLQALSMALSGVLQGLERERNVLINSAVSFFVHVIAVYVLIGQFKMDITGVLIAVIILYALLFVLNLVSIQRRLSLRIDWGRMIGIPVIASGVAGVVIVLINRLLAEKLASSAMAWICFLAGTLIYVILILALHGISERELKEIPGGEIVIVLGRALRLM